MYLEIFNQELKSFIYIKIKIGHNHSLLKSIIMYKTLEIVDNKQGIFYSCVIVMESVL